MEDLDYEVLHPNVYYFPSPFDDIEKLVDTIEEVNSEAITPWDTWYAGNTDDTHPYGDIKVLRREKLDLETEPETKEKALYVLNDLAKTMEKCCTVYMKEHGVDTEEELDYLNKNLYEPRQVFGLRRYNETEAMGPHRDGSSEQSDNYTIAVYFDSDYEGGEISIVEEGVNVAVKPNKGSIVIFPSDYLHESRPLTKGRKTMITHVHRTINKWIEL